MPLGDEISQGVRPKQIVLWVDDDLFVLEPLFERVRRSGYEVLGAHDGDEAFAILRERHDEIGLVILDIMLPAGTIFAGADTFDGRRTGLLLARRIRDEFPAMRLLGASVVRDPEVEEWFERYASGYIRKPALPGEVLNRIARAITGRRSGLQPRCFIVHGHDHESLYALKNYLQNVLGLGRPAVLREEPSLGRTLIEKFELASEEIDLVFVLLTPDDRANASESDADVRRSRQNVIFELGFFYAKMQRRSGRVVVLYKRKTELPTDISGIIYIDISRGVEAAGEEIRRELRDWL